MKYIKTFENYKINETGEWSRDVDWDFVKNNPDCDSTQCSWISQFAELLEDVKGLLNNEDDLVINDIKGFDMYQGPYAMVNIKGTPYTVWTQENEQLWIEDFPVDNTSEEGNLAGYLGDVHDIGEVINNL